MIYTIKYFHKTTKRARTYIRNYDHPYSFKGKVLNVDSVIKMWKE